MKLSSLALGFSLISLLVTGVACQGKRGTQSASGLKRVHFEFDSASVASSMIPTLESNVLYLKKHKTLEVVLEGHADERGTNEYNLALGDRRASSVKNYLSSQGIGASRLRTVSYGEEQPLQTGHNESAWYQNRRVEFVRQ